MKTRQEIVFDILRLILFCVLGFACFLNTKEICETYFNYEITTTTNKEAVKSFVLPTFVICAEKPYTDTKKIMFTLEDYEQNTLNPRHFIKNIRLLPFSPSSNINEVFDV